MRLHRDRTQDSSVVFARWRQYEPPSNTLFLASKLYWFCPLLSRSKNIDHQTCQGMPWAGSFSSSKLHLCLCVPWTYQTQHPKLHLDQFSHFCTAQGRQSLYFTMGCHFLPITPVHEGSGLHQTHGSLGPPESSSKQHHDQFSHFCTAHGLDRSTDHATPSAASGCI